MASYRVVLEMEVETDSPLAAAEQVQDWVREPTTALMYYVQHVSSQDVFSVDMDEHADQAVIECDNYIPLIN